MRSNAAGPTRAVVAGALSLVVVLTLAGPLASVDAVSPPSGPPTTDGPTAARLGAGWLAAQVDGGVPLQAFGGPRWGSTIEAGLALVGTGVGELQLAAILIGVEANRETIVDPDGPEGPDGAGELANVILLAVATGNDPRDVGDAPGNDLVARLEATMRTTGPDAGLYGATNPGADGAYRQGLALVALVAAGENPDPAAVTWLRNQQCPDGSWYAYRADTAAACVSGGFPGPDTNSTALALMGLVAASGGEGVAAALDWLAATQNEDGGWGYLPGDATEPNSTALVLQALGAVGARNDERFAGALEALLSFQIGCDAPAEQRGAFFFPGGDGSPNLFATVQAVPAALGAALPPEAGDTVTERPVVDCGDGTTTTTTTTTTSTTTTTTTTTSTTVPTTTSAPATVSGVTVTATPLSTTGASSSSVAGTSTARGSLAATGAEAGRLSLSGAVLVLTGAMLLLLRRRELR